MATYKDKQQTTWSINLDVVVLEKIRDLHKIELANLETDPLLLIRAKPEKLVQVMHVLCQDQIDEKGKTDTDFGKSADTTTMLDALSEAIIEFFPTGQASHVRAVLAKHEEMARTTDELILAKMDRLMSDPNTKKRLNEKANVEIDKELEAMFPLNSRPGS